MASTIAMFTGLSGLNANARSLDVTGNNIANVNTTAFKSTRLAFASQFSRNLGLGSAPNGDTGGSNPRQVGLGVTIAGTQRNFGIGSLSATGSQTDMAIGGDGFFIVDRGGSDRLFTRSGAFTSNSERQLITATGERVLGWGIDDNFQVDRSALVPIAIPLGELRIAEATENVRMGGTLNNAESSVVATSGTRIALGAMTDTSGPIATTSLVTNLRNLAGNPIAAVGDTLSLDTPKKGGLDLPTRTLEITATTTLQEVMDFFAASLGIQATGANPDGFTPGVTLDALTGIVTIVGNTGIDNGLGLTPQEIQVRTPAGTTASDRFSLTRVAEANGESAFKEFSAFDTLGNEVKVNITLTLVSRGATGSTWRYETNSPGDTDGDPRIASGTISFDTAGRVIGDGKINVSVNRAAVGAGEPLLFSLDLSRTIAAANPAVTGGNTTTPRSTLSTLSRDGSPLGTLTNFAVGADGTIVGSFDNGLTRTIGQVAIAAFANPAGLIDAGQNLFQVGANSGNPNTVVPGEGGTGGIVAGSLELSNVDLSNEFINLILASTGYSASSRVISTSDQLLQQLLTIGR